MKNTMVGQRVKEKRIAAVRNILNIITTIRLRRHASIVEPSVTISRNAKLKTVIRVESYLSMVKRTGDDG